LAVNTLTVDRPVDRFSEIFDR